MSQGGRTVEGQDKREFSVSWVKKGPEMLVMDTRWRLGVMIGLIQRREKVNVSVKDRSRLRRKSRDGSLHFGFSTESFSGFCSCSQS